MPVFDVDGGLNWRNYNPAMFGHKIPQSDKPFYFGASNVPINLGLTQKQYDGSGVNKCSCRLKSVKKLPHLRK